MSTTRDGLTWDNDAKYYYYIHGPLARMETGEHKVQGSDYAYTINGELKGVNSAALDAEKDMGQDGKVTNLATTPYWSSTFNDMHKWTARDAFGYVLGYFGTGTAATNDYESITASASSGNRWLCSVPNTGLGDNLYNGNIRHVVLGLMKEDETAAPNRATAYKHDQLQRLKQTYNYFNTGNDYSSITGSGWTYLRENVWYDANGNITGLQRYDDNSTTPALMDQFAYQYNGNTNKLNCVIDGVSTPGIGTDRETQSVNNYAYDEIGQLTADNISGITNIVWNVRNKPTRISESGKEIYFEYDEMGHRIKKEVQSGSENNWIQQWYVLDPQGNPVAVYEHKYTNPSGTTYNEIFDLEEHQIYGSDRLGTRQYTNYNLWIASFTCSSFNVDHTFHSPSGKTNLPILASSYQQNKRMTGNKYYELKNHTNNIQAVITDYKIPYAATCSGITNVDYYTADVKSYTDYFVFGGTMNNRFTGGNGYRYGFQGQERDNEIKGDDNSVNFEYRMHDPQYGRFLSIDPLAKEYHYWTAYQFSGNVLIMAIELEGLEPSAFDGALIAEDVYFAKSKHKVIGDGWERTNIRIAHVQLTDKWSGFKSAIYRRKMDNGKYEYVYATAGTEDMKDALEDGKQLYGHSRQYDISKQNAEFLKEYFDKTGENLTFVGHSLGGGLASVNAAATGLYAMTYNAAPVSIFTLLNINVHDTKIDAYVVEGEALSYWSAGIGMYPMGKRIYLPGPDFINPLKGLVENDPVLGSIKMLQYSLENTNKRIEAHTMGYIKNSIKKREGYAKKHGLDPWQYNLVKQKKI